MSSSPNSKSHLDMTEFPRILLESLSEKILFQAEWSHTLKNSLHKGIKSCCTCPRLENNLMPFVNSNFSTCATERLTLAKAVHITFPSFFPCGLCLGFIVGTCESFSTKYDIINRAFLFLLCPVSLEHLIFLHFDQKSRKNTKQFRKTQTFCCETIKRPFYSHLKI